MTTEQILTECIKISESKAHDYASKDNRHENFDRCRQLISWFRSDIDKVYVTLIAVKLARLANLLDSKEPKNESINDTFIDLTNYCALWGSKRIHYVIDGGEVIK